MKLSILQCKIITVFISQENYCFEYIETVHLLQIAFAIVFNSFRVSLGFRRNAFENYNKQLDSLAERFLVRLPRDGHPDFYVVPFRDRCHGIRREFTYNFDLHQECKLANKY